MKNLTVIEHSSQRVLTTEQIAEVYGTASVNIRTNFNNNKKNFTEGKHYFILRGQDLAEFKNKTNDISFVMGKQARQLLLWTEQGASRHCKILDTPKAWEQFDHLEETYFRVKAQIQTPQQPQLLDSYMIADPIERAIRWIEEYQEKKLLEAEKQVLLPKAEFHDEFLDADGLTSMTNVGINYLKGMSGRGVARLLQKHGVLHQKKIDGLYVPMKGYEHCFRLCHYPQRNSYGSYRHTPPILKLNNVGIDLAVKLFKKDKNSLAAR